MRFLFPRWVDTMTRVGLVAVVVGVGGCVGGLFALVRTPWRRGTQDDLAQPVQFDHRHHVQDAGIDCLYCHGQATRSPFAGVPTTQVCMGCHAQVWNESPALDPVRKSYFSGRPISWNRVHHVPDFVFFDHSAHLHVGIGCSACHGRVDEMAAVQQVAPLTMAWCLGCHRDPAPHLRPFDLLTDMTWEQQRHSPTRQRELARTRGVRSLTHCSACHR
jgi:hypothetical protein